MEIRNHVSRMSLRKRQKCFLHIVFLDIICFDETMNISVKIYLRNCWLVIDARYSLSPQSSFHGFITNQLNDLLPFKIVSSICRALHRYHTGQGSHSRTILHFFTLSAVATAIVASIPGMIFFHLIMCFICQL